MLLWKNIVGIKIIIVKESINMMKLVNTHFIMFEQHRTANLRYKEVKLTRHIFH